MGVELSLCLCAVVTTARGGGGIKRARILRFGFTKIMIIVIVCWLAERLGKESFARTTLLTIASTYLLPVLLVVNRYFFASLTPVVHRLRAE